ncbi:MAG: FtsQ-type POTRA domain-containing protein [Clostridia bacterium]|nr:FtsQ-type POTRA domain-containing protein [Clostridia bacterium]
MEESSGKKPKKPKHNEADNEATLASIKYYKYTRKLKQLVVHRFLPLAMAFVLIVGFVLYFFRLQHLNFVNLTGYAAEDVFAATGIKKNAFVFSVSSSDIEKRLRTKFPYIQSVSVELDLPDTVSLVFEEDCALFYTQIYDEYFVVSESMRVLARYDTTDELDAGLRAVTLPAVSYAVVGHSLQFFDSSYLTFLKEFLAVLEISDIYDRITSMDLSNRFDILVTYEDRLDIYLGDDEYLESNLSFAKSIIEGLKDNDAGDITIIDNKTASFSAVSTR